MNEIAPEFIIATLLLAVVALASLAARRIRVPAPIFLVLAGTALAYTPHFPQVSIDPDLVLLGLLPPLLYAAGVGTSWRGFRRNLGWILVLAVGCVLVTATAVAAMMHFLLDLPWGVGFVLGAVVSPPDAVAPMAIARRLPLPRKTLAILEGEGLVNDATALVLFSFAVVAVTTGAVSIPAAAATFGTIVIGEIVWGLAVGWFLLRVRAWAKDTEVEMILSLLTPFAAFWVPHFLGGSGVLAAVAAGLFASWHGPRHIPPATRLQGYFFWGLTVFVIEGLTFLLTGLQSREVFETPDPVELTRMGWAALYTVLVVVLVRFLWVFAAHVAARCWRGAKAPPQAKHAWQESALIGFTGIRGVVSMVAALSIPDLAGQTPFPERDLILFVTFAVIMSTLCGQGALLPAVIKFLKLDKAGRAEARLASQRETAARIAAVDGILLRLEGLASSARGSRTIANLRRQHEERRLDLEQMESGSFDRLPMSESTALQLRLLATERGAIAGQFGAGKLTDEARRRIERELDLEESRLHHLLHGTSDRDAIENLPDEARRPNEAPISTTNTLPQRYADDLYLTKAARQRSGAERPESR